MKNSYAALKYFEVMKVERRENIWKVCFGSGSPFVFQVELKMHWYGNLFAQNGHGMCRQLAIVD